MYKSMAFKKCDEDWVKLMIDAKRVGIPKSEVEHFIKKVGTASQLQINRK